MAIDEKRKCGLTNNILLLLFGVSLVLSRQASYAGDFLLRTKVARQAGDRLIGYTELRTDLPGGRHANTRTSRAMVVNLDGKGRRELGGDLVDGPDTWTQFAGWSPDGRQAIIVRGWESPDNARWEEEHKAFRMEPGQWLLDSCLLELATGKLTNLTAVERVSHYNGGLFFLPDGRGLGFTPLINGVSKPFLMDLDGRNKHDVSGHGPGFAYGYSASPDGKLISYHEDYQVFIANVDGSGKKRIESGHPFNFGPRWSADGEWLLFVSGVRGKSNPYVVRRDGTDLRKLADLNGYQGWILFLDVPDFHEGSSDVPVWSADGKSVFYTAQVGKNVELFRVTRDGRTEQLTQTPQGTLHYHPQPSPDGQWLAYGSKRDGARQLYALRLADNTERRLTDLKPGHAAMWPHWQALANRMPDARADTSAIVLSKDFKLAKLVQMPRSASDHWRFFRRDYGAANAVEWQIRMRGLDRDDSPLWEDVNSADFVLAFPSDSPVTLHWSKGSHSAPDDFQPREEALQIGKPFVLESFGGRSSDGVMPYFNLATSGGGLIVAVGWTGDWRASFELQGRGEVWVKAGLSRARFKLSSGEEVRLPSVLVMSYRGDWLDGQNQFRRLMLQAFTPTNHAPMKLMPVAASVHGLIGFNDTTETNLAALARDIAALKLPIDTYWLDAGWNQGGFPLGQGNPNPDSLRFPHGLVPVGAVAREVGFRFLVWFEPERAMRGTWLDRQHPSWLLHPSGTLPELRYQERDGFRLLDLGHSDARRWIIDQVSEQIRSAGIAVYRQDCNLYPASFWHTDEPPDRVGLREVRHISGLYEFLDELARRHPGLILDNCASGGQRLDFEMMRRCVVLWRSDSCWDAKSFPRNVQAMTHGLSLWLPLHGLGAAGVDDIALRSGMGACASFAINFRDAVAVEALRRHLARYLKVRPLFTQDYYPLTPWSEDPAKLLAFQFHDPASGEGLVQVLRGSAAEEFRARLRLRGLDPAARYAFTDWDGRFDTTVFNGGDLMTNGLPVLARRNGEARVFSYSCSSLPFGKANYDSRK